MAGGEGPCLGGRLSLPPPVHDAWSSAVPGPRGARGLREGGPRGRVARAARTRSALPPQARGLTEGAVSAIASIRISPCDLCVTYLFCVRVHLIVLRWSSLDIERIDHLGKGFKLRSTSSRKFQNPRGAKALMSDLDVPSLTYLVKGP
jgi:hypothetical protein